jgi:hypothetical protein
VTVWFFGLLAAILLLLGWIAPRAGDRWLGPLERGASSLSRNKGAVIVALGLATVLLRLALLPISPVPLPFIHDAFSYLLAADTLAHGRLSNPPHPMWIFFDTFHVLQQPTYASKYPPGPGAAMALGQILGHPWIGVLLSTCAMVMAMTWMLQGWFPPSWALLGGVLVLLRLGLVNPWMDSYFNPSVATTGAAFVLGAYPRIFHSDGMRHSIVMGAGAVILASSRPFEGLVFCIPVAIALIAALLRKSDHLGRHTLDFKKLVPAGAVLSAGAIFLAYYNYRVTHNPLQFPYLLYHREYFNYPVFAWGKATAPLHYTNPQFETFFNVWNRKAYSLTWRGWGQRSVVTLLLCWQVLPGFVLAPPFVLLPRILRDRRMRLPLIQLALCGTGLLSVVWFQPHYTAPIAATFFVLLVQAMRHLRHSELGGRPIGLFFTRLIMILAILGVGLQAEFGPRAPAWARKRAEIARQLEATAGKHLVLVHYSPDHNVHAEWVYNRADIDGSKVVWARQIPGRNLTPLLNYFKDRQVWWLEPDQASPQLRPLGGFSGPDPESDGPPPARHPSDYQDQPFSDQ